MGPVQSTRHARPKRAHRERTKVRTRLQVRTHDGRPVAPLAECREIGLEGLLATAAKGIQPGTDVRVALVLPNGLIFESPGRVSGCCTTLHLEPFGPTRGLEDDAIFEITFDDHDPDTMWPIASLLLDRSSPARSNHSSHSSVIRTRTARSPSRLA